VIFSYISPSVTIVLAGACWGESSPANTMSLATIILAMVYTERVRSLGRKDLSFVFMFILYVFWVSGAREVECG